jgi:hypothetical protein
MTILNNSQSTPPSQTAEGGKDKISKILNRMCKQINGHLVAIKKVTDNHGRSAIDTEFGSDATEFANLYAQAKALAELHPGCTIEDLPS